VSQCQYKKSVLPAASNFPFRRAENLQNIVAKFANQKQKKEIQIGKVDWFFLIVLNVENKQQLKKATQKKALENIVQLLARQN
jgi:hypothetical protein